MDYTPGEPAPHGLRVIDSYGYAGTVVCRFGNGLAYDEPHCKTCTCCTEVLGPNSVADLWIVNMDAKRFNRIGCPRSYAIRSHGHVLTLPALLTPLEEK